MLFESPSQIPIACCTAFFRQITIENWLRSNIFAAFFFSCKIYISPQFFTHNGISITFFSVKIQIEKNEAKNNVKL